MATINVSRQMVTLLLTLRALLSWVSPVVLTTILLALFDLSIIRLTILTSDSFIGESPTDINMHIPYICVSVTFVLVSFVAPMPFGLFGLNKVHKILPSADKQAVLDCVLANRGVDKVTDCWVVDKESTDGFRDAMAKRYYDMLTDGLKHIDGCLHKEAMMTPLPTECSYLDHVDLVEHCFLHHQCQQYEPCENISYPHIALPDDTRTLFLYSTWLNVSTEHYAENIPNSSSDLKTIVKQCALHCSTWLYDPNSVCHNIDLPNFDVQYSDQMRSMQKLYQEMQVTDRKRDCEHYHQDDLKNGTGECGKHYPHFENLNMSINLDVLKTPKPKPVTEPTVVLRAMPSTEMPPPPPPPREVSFLNKLLSLNFFNFTEYPTAILKI